MLYKFTLYTLFISVFISGCSTSNQNVQITDKPAYTSQYKSQTGYHYALIQKNHGSWKIIYVADTPIEKRANIDQEILQVSETSGDVVPYFAKEFPLNKSNRYECTKPSDEYTPCSSSLSSNFRGDGIVSFFKSSSSSNYKYIDKELIDEATKETNLFSAIEAKKPLFERNQYVRSFNAARTADEYNQFILKYSYMQNALNLLTMARERRDNIYVQEQNEKIEAAKQRAKEEELRAEQERLAYKIQEAKTQQTMVVELIEEKSRKNHKAKIENFRKTLKSGAETNCGTIIELKESSAKVYFPVKNYANEHWIDINKLFPKDHGCRFVKGNYIAPPSF